MKTKIVSGATIGKLVAILFFALVTTGCNSDFSFSALPQQALQSLSDPGSVTPPGSGQPSAACTQVVQNTTSPLRILFMVDNSGSTNQTDPPHYYRVKTVQDFLATYGQKTNFTYSFGYFSGTTSSVYDQSLMKFVLNPTVVFGTAANLSSALTLYSALNPGGYTPYGAAFSKLASEVSGDEATGSTQNYAVVFMSDGMPTDIPDPIDVGIVSLVNGLMQTAQGNGKSLLTVSAVYFGPENDATSIEHLNLMAKQGHGIFVDTNLLGGAALSLDTVVSVPGTVCGQ